MSLVCRNSKRGFGVPNCETTCMSERRHRFWCVKPLHEFFRTEKFFRTADSGGSFRIREVLSIFGVLQNSKVLSNSGFGSFSQDSGGSSKLISAFKQRIRVFLSRFGRFFQNSEGSSKVLLNGCRSFFQRMSKVLLNNLEFF